MSRYNPAKIAKRKAKSAIRRKIRATLGAGVATVVLAAVPAMGADLSKFGLPDFGGIPAISALPGLSDIPRVGSILGSSPAVAAFPADAATAAESLAALEAITIADETRASEYSGKREKLFGRAWPDVDRDGCNERQEAMAAVMTEVELADDRCTVLREVLADPYTGKTIHFVHDRLGRDSAAVQIDHVGALSESWASGAHSWDQATRVALTNDPVNLIVSDGPANEKKSDKDLGEWSVPANPDFTCAYASQYVTVKATYQLTMDQNEHDKAREILTSCAE